MINALNISTNPYSSTDMVANKGGPGTNPARQALVMYETLLGKLVTKIGDGVVLHSHGSAGGTSVLVTKAIQANHFKKFEEQLANAVTASGIPTKWLNEAFRDDLYAWLNDPSNAGLSSADLKPLEKELLDAQVNISKATNWAKDPIIQQTHLKELHAAHAEVEKAHEKKQIFDSNVHLLENINQFQELTLACLHRVLPADLITKFANSQNAYSKSADPIQLLRGTALVATAGSPLPTAPVFTPSATLTTLGGLNPQGRPLSHYRRLQELLNFAVAEIGSIDPECLNNYSAQLWTSPVYQMKPSYVFSDWFHKNFLQALVPLENSSAQLSVSTKLRLLLQLIQSVPRFSETRADLLFSYVPTVTDLTTQADINAKVFKRLEAIDTRHWSETGGKPEDIKVNFFKRDNQKTKAQLYNGGGQIVCERCKKKGHKARDCRSKAPVSNRNQATASKVKCFNCDKIGHKAADCRLKKTSKNGKRKRGREFENQEPNQRDSDQKPKQKKHHGQRKVSRAHVARQQNNEGNEDYTDNADGEDVINQDATIPDDDENIRLHVTVLQSSQSAATGDHDPKILTASYTLDSGAERHMLQRVHPSMRNIQASTRRAIFGNGGSNEITHHGSLGQLRDVQVCPHLNRQLLSVGKLAIDNRQVSIFTSKGAYILKPNVCLDISSDDVSFFCPLVNGLYECPSETVHNAMR